MQNLKMETERIIPDQTEQGIISIHLKRYLFASDFCRDKQVLDVACGTGYGAYELAQVSRNVAGIDVSNESIEYAKQRYHKENINFQTMDACHLTFSDQVFDTVCSFETIEHLSDAKAFLREITRVLKADGIFLVSTPCVKNSTQRPENPFHIQEWSPQDFKILLSHYFESVELFGQRRKQSALHKWLQRADFLNLRENLLSSLSKRVGVLTGTTPFADMSLDDLEITPNNLKDALYTIAVCRLPRRRQIKVAHVVISGEVAGGQVICERVVTALRKRGNQAIVISQTEGDFTERLKKDKIPVFLIPFKKTYHIQDAFRLAQLLKKEQVDLVHTHSMVPGNVLSRLAAKIAGVPCISHIHIENVFNSNPLIQLYQMWFDRWTSNHCYKLIAVSGATKQSLIRQKIPADQVEVILNGIYQGKPAKPAVSREEILRQWGIPDHHHLIGIVGRMSPVKGFEEFLESMTTVCRQILAVTALLIGQDSEFGGRYERKLRELAELLGLSGHVIFTGFQPDALSFIAAMDFLVAPSKAEGLPITILEAMSLQKAVIASNVGGVSEVIQDGETGLLVRVGDTNRLAEAMLKLLNNPRLCQQMGENGFLRVQESFTEEKMLNRIFEIYEEAVRI